MVEARVWFDGASRGNPGRMAGGAIMECAGRRRVIRGPAGHGTNNEAEYQGLILGLRAARDAGADSVVVRGDSQLVIRQLEGRYRVNAPNLQPYYREAKALMDDFESVRFEWVRRGANEDADRAANEALDG